LYLTVVGTELATGGQGLPASENLGVKAEAGDGEGGDGEEDDDAGGGLSPHVLGSGRDLPLVVFPLSCGHRGQSGATLGVLACDHFAAPAAFFQRDREAAAKLRDRRRPFLAVSPTSTHHFFVSINQPDRPFSSLSFFFVARRRVVCLARAGTSGLQTKSR
jgi:hypothetical protein